jgi:hypothetical protein
MEDTNNREMFDLTGNDFTFDVDLSQLPCGFNGALYLVSMLRKNMGRRRGLGDDTCGGTYSLDRYAGNCDANRCDCKFYYHPPF